MQKVISINLNGNAYQVEETGYAALVAYLEGAQRQLKDNPDRAEIIADLEQAIAEKCRRFLNAHKSVVTDGEVDQIIREMGPVDAEPGSGEQAGATGGAKAGGPKRLYLLREGAMLAGVCNGMAAYLHIDPTIVRIVFVLLAILTKGVFFFVYVVLAVVIPPANTPEERAAAYGETFNAQELIDRAKRTYAGFTASHGRFGDWGRNWGRHWRRQERQWRRQFDRTIRSRRWESAPAFVPPAGYTARVVAGVMVPLLTIVSALLFWVGAHAVLSLATERHSASRCPTTSRSGPASCFWYSSVSRPHGRGTRRGGCRTTRSAGRTTPRSPRWTGCCRWASACALSGSRISTSRKCASCSELFRMCGTTCGARRMKSG